MARHFYKSFDGSFYTKKLENCLCKDCKKARRISIDLYIERDLPEYLKVNGYRSSKRTGK